MSTPSGVPVLSLLDSAEAVYRAQRRYRFVSWWALITSAWIVAALVPLLLLLLVDLGENADLVGTIWVVLLVVGVILFSLLSPFAVVHAVRVTRTLRNFLKDFYPVWYKVRFEVLPPAGATVDEQTFNKLSELHPFLRNARVRYNVDLPGRRGSHRFSVCGRSSPGGFDFLPGQLALVRRFNGPGPVTREELVCLKEDAFDVARKTGSNLIVLAAVSPTGFQQEAVDWARSPEGFPTKNLASSLLSYRDGKFSVVLAIVFWPNRVPL